MGLKKYYLIAGSMAFIGSPLIVSIPFFIPEGIGFFILPVPMVIIPLIWIKIFKRPTEFSRNTIQALLPIFAAFVYYTLVWILLFGMHEDFEMSRTSLFILFTLPYLGLNMTLAFFNADPILLPCVYIVVTLLALIPFFIVRRYKENDRAETENDFRL